jgi:hypothetical protein
MAWLALPRVLLIGSVAYVAALSAASAQHARNVALALALTALCSWSAAFAKSRSRACSARSSAARSWEWRRRSVGARFLGLGDRSSRSSRASP